MSSTTRLVITLATSLHTLYAIFAPVWYVCYKVRYLIQMDPKFEFNTIARDIKIELGRNYLTIPTQDKIQLPNTSKELL